MQMWLWSLNHLQKANDAEGNRLYQSSRHGVTFPLADALCWLLASRCQILDVLELEAKGGEAIAPSTLTFFTTSAMCKRSRRRRSRTHLRRAGVRLQPASGWDEQGCASCYHGEELEAMEGMIPGIASLARATRM